MDDNYGAAETFDGLYSMLHNRYFPRIAWAKLTLKPTKTLFFQTSIEALELTVGTIGLRPSIDKVAKIRNYPIPKNEKELNGFVFMTTFLKWFIPGRAEHARIMKEVVKWEKEEEGKGKKKKVAWEWKEEQQRSFEFVKTAIVENSVSGGNINQQYHLACNASKIGIGGVVFQMLKDRFSKAEDFRFAKVVMYISQRLNDAETRYTNTEREGLAVLRCLEEVRWMVTGSPFPTKVYTDHSALLSILKGDGVTHKGRMGSWMVRMSEYDVEYYYINGKENGIADGLSRMPEQGMNLPPTIHEQWEADVAMTETIPHIWKEWELDDWYGDVVEYKLTGMLSREPWKSNKNIKLKAARFVMMEGATATLLYRENSGELAKCIRQGQVESVLRRSHDSHGHFSGNMTLKMLHGKHYWPN